MSHFGEEKQAKSRSRCRHWHSSWEERAWNSNSKTEAEPKPCNSLNKAGAVRRQNRLHGSTCFHHGVPPPEGKSQPKAAQPQGAGSGDRQRAAPRGCQPHPVPFPSPASHPEGFQPLRSPDGFNPCHETLPALSDDKVILGTDSFYCLQCSWEHHTGTGGAQTVI